MKSIVLIKLFLISIVFNMYCQEAIVARNTKPKLFYSSIGFSALNTQYIYHNNPGKEINISNKDTYQIGDYYDFGYGINLSTGVKVSKNFSLGFMYNYTTFSVPGNSIDDSFSGIDPRYYNELTMYDYGVLENASITKRGGKINYNNIGIEIIYLIKERWRLSPYFHFNPWYSIASCENVYMMVENPAQNYSKELKLLGFSNNGHGFGEETGIGGVYKFNDYLQVFLELNHRLQHVLFDMEKSKYQQDDFDWASISTTSSKLNTKLGFTINY